MDGNLTTGDLALMRDDGFGGNCSFMWIFALLILMYGGNGFGGFGGRGAMMPGNYATTEQMTAGFNNQNTQNQLQQIALSSANNNYETARLISQQTNEMLQQNNANLINAIQGFNAVNQNITQQANNTNSLLQQMMAQMNECCCSIKTQMLQDRLDATQSALVAAQGSISNANQSQYLLSQLGRFVAYPSGATTSGT